MKIVKLLDRMFLKVPILRWFIVIFLSGTLLGIGIFGIIEDGNFYYNLLYIFISLITLFFALKRLIFYLKDLALKTDDEELKIFLEKGVMPKKKIKIVLIGGGTGLSTILKGLKELTIDKKHIELNAVVTVTDDGGSSGRLRKEFNILPPGDIRNCIVALSYEDKLLLDLFQYRFDQDSELKGHNFGNLFITALTNILGDFSKAIKYVSKILTIRGNIIPITLEHITLKAEFEGDMIATGETNIVSKKKKIKKLSLIPEDSVATIESQMIIKSADLIVLGPGSLYTSVIPNLLVNNIIENIKKSKAKKVYICNLMTQQGETDGLDYVIVNSKKILKQLKMDYNRKEQNPVVVEDKKISKLTKAKILKKDLLALGTKIRHDPIKVAEAILELVE
jgi:uncharacterized cofD-like protein